MGINWREQGTGPGNSIGNMASGEVDLLFEDGWASGEAVQLIKLLRDYFGPDREGIKAIGVYVGPPKKLKQFLGKQHGIRQYKIKERQYACVLGWDSEAGIIVTAPVNDPQLVTDLERNGLLIQDLGQIYGSEGTGSRPTHSKATQPKRWIDGISNKK